MNPANQRKRFRAFAKYLENGHPLTDKQKKDLINIFRDISNENEPTEVLGLNYGDGKSKQAEKSRIYIDFVMHWIACAIEPEIDENGQEVKPCSMTEAFEKGSEIAKQLFDAVNSDSYDPSYIKKLWYEYKKQGKVSILRTPSCQDSIYEYPVPDPKK